MMRRAGLSRHTHLIIGHFGSVILNNFLPSSVNMDHLGATLLLAPVLDTSPTQRFPTIPPNSIPLIAPRATFIHRGFFWAVRYLWAGDAQRSWNLCKLCVVQGCLWKHNTLLWKSSAAYKISKMRIPKAGWGCCMLFQQCASGSCSLEKNCHQLNRL